MFAIIAVITCSLEQTRYELCKTQGIGLIMLASNLCNFSPLLRADISLLEPGTVLKTNFKVRTAKAYDFRLVFHFPTVQDRLKDNIIGDNYDSVCHNFIMGYSGYDEPNERIAKHPKYYGAKISLRIVIRQLKDSSVILDKTFHTLCSSGHGGEGDKDKFRDFGYVKLDRGKYLIEIINLSAQPELKSILTKVVLSFGRMKY